MYGIKNILSRGFALIISFTFQLPFFSLYLILFFFLPIPFILHNHFWSFSDKPIFFILAQKYFCVDGKEISKHLRVLISSEAHNLFYVSKINKKFMNNFLNVFVWINYICSASSVISKFVTFLGNDTKE